MILMNIQLSTNLITNTIVFLFIVTFYVKSQNEKKPGIIYIMVWTDPDREPFKWWEPKRRSFKSKNCTYQNCFIVKDKDYFLDPSDYDVVLFNPLGMDSNIPPARSDNQIYIFVALESAAYLQLGEQWNWFFNYTWTYKLDSDITYPYMVVKNKRGEVVGPKINARWRNITRMKPTPDSIKERLKSKYTAAAWFVTNCPAINKRMAYGNGVGEALKKYNLNLDVYGRCGNMQCPKYRLGECLGLVEGAYYFYFAFENSNCEDYVTEKLMTALGHYAVPVVLGGANYSRFMPDGIYLNGNYLTEEEVAYKINEAIKNPEIYYDYFRWHRYYTYEFINSGDENDPLCQFCAFLNDESLRNRRRVYAGFTKWWNEYGDSKDKEGIVVKFEDSSPAIKSVLTYKDKNVQSKTEEVSSSFETVNSFVGDLFNYYFS